MKKINPQTNYPYRAGDVNAFTGKVFIQYDKTRRDSDGYYRLKWGSAESLKAKNKTALAWQKAYPKRWGEINKKQLLNNRGRAGQLYRAARIRAKNKDLHCTITKLWVLQALDTGVCQLSGIPFDLKPTKKYNFNPYSPSIDRIDSSKGYTFENSRVILTALNVALSEYGLDTYVTIAKKVISKQKR